jgi:hypothetical protein
LDEGSHPFVDSPCVSGEGGFEAMIVLFTAALAAGSAAIAAWIATRFPGLAPQSMLVRLAGAPVALALLMAVPVDPGTYVSLYGTLFGLYLPTLTLVWLGSFWLLQSLRDGVHSSFR